MKGLLLKGFRLVYEGGHHGVWCDGRHHVRVTTHDGQFMDSFRCDCERWNPC